MATIGDSCVISSTDTSVSDFSEPFSVFTPPTSPKAVAAGPKHKLITEGDIQLCRLNHTRTIVSKIMNSKYLRRWETHKIKLDHSEMRSTTPIGFMEQAVPYSTIEDVHIVSRWDIGNHFCVRITLPDGSILLQANNSYIRDQWMYSVQWKKHIYRYEKLLKNTRRPEVLVKEIKNLIDVSMTTPIQDASVYQFPLDLISEVLQQNSTESISRAAHENIIIAISPLLENNHPTQEICDFFSLHCRSCPRSSLVMDLFTPMVQRILKHNMDFGKYPRMRTFVQEYLQALKCQNDGTRVVQSFIENMHGPASTCPHPRVLPNLVAVCLAAIYNLFEEKKNDKQDLTQWKLNESETDGDVDNTENLTIEKICLEFSPMRRRNAFYKLNNKKVERQESAMQDNMCQSVFDAMDWENKLFCFVAMMETMAEFTDWRLTLGSLLQPIPFPDDAIADTEFTSHLKQVIQRIAADKTCEVHQTLLGIREGKEGWFHLYCPGGIACDDDGQLWGLMLETLIRCCSRRKKFLQGMTKMNGPVMLLALRDNVAAMETLCAMLEMEVIDSQDMKMQMITTLQSTTEGKRMYAELCDRQIALRELQQKGGPKKLTLPSKSTDNDLAKMLSSGSFGNLECLSLAFTQVTSACAQELIKLPSLRYLNLWSTQFGDSGLELISEHLQKLQVLNLCETPVTDKGLVSLAALKHLRKLNLNSTSLSALTFEGLKEKLPALQECDVRYTDAW